MVAMPLSGWMMSSAAGFSVSVFGWATLPDLVPESKLLKGFFGEAHEVMAFLLMALIAGHVGAVVVHFVHQKVNLLKRMSLWQK
jgi:cytochrome b561